MGKTGRNTAAASGALRPARGGGSLRPGPACGGLGPARGGALCPQWIEGAEEWTAAGHARRGARAWSCTAAAEGRGEGAGQI